MGNSECGMRNSGHATRHAARLKLGDHIAGIRRCCPIPIGGRFMSEPDLHHARYDGYGWIKVPKYVMNDSASWEVRYQELERHHIQETTFLIDKVRELAAELEKHRAE